MIITIIGYGKMGKTIEKLAENDGHVVAATFSGKNREALTLEKLSQSDVAIEFSRPEAAFDNISACLKAGVPVVSGTTGWLERLDEAKALCKQSGTALFYSSNFSIGVHIFFAVNRYLAARMKHHPAYEVEMEEIHHLEKVDFPSGTAITLAQAILEHQKGKSGWQATLAGGDSHEDQPADKIQIFSKRIDQVPGTHTVKWSSGIDTIEIRHTAHSREGFAVGALAAAEWIIGKEGYFDMKDMLGF